MGGPIDKIYPRSWFGRRVVELERIPRITGRFATSNMLLPPQIPRIVPEGVKQEDISSIKHLSGNATEEIVQPEQEVDSPPPKEGRVMKFIKNTGWKIAAGTAIAGATLIGLKFLFSDN